MKTVLAIVTSPAMGRLLQHSLGENYALTVCYTAEEGELLLWNRYDSLILELNLPGCSGLDFLERNRISLPTVVIGLSSIITQYVAEAATGAGVDALIRMPCTGGAIARLLDDLMCKKDPSLSGG